MKICSPIIQSGLGNILFKIAAAYSYCLTNNFDFFIYRKLCMDSPHAYFDSYINTIFSKISFNYENAPKLPIFKEAAMIYREIPKFDTSFYLYGDFQSVKYFKNHEKQVKELFSTDLTDFDGSNTCSIHVRRGDYIYMSDRYIQLDLDYYIKACNLVPKNTKFIVFSNDMDWCKKNFTKENGFENISFAKKNESYIDLELMSKCNHNIIANSTFSWWGAYLNKNANKTVITPRKWITQHLANLSCEGMLDRYMNNILLKEWIKI